MSVPALVAAFDGLGRELHGRLAREPGNVVLSPLSIGLALAMTLSGARGATEAELKRVLGLEISRGDLEAASADLVRKLEGYGQVDAIHIAIANALLLDERYGGMILSPYQRLLRASYSAEIMTGASPAAVNAWVRDRTMGLIPHLLQDAGELIAAMILNAMVFAAPWACPFDAEETRPCPFILAGGDTIAVPTMRCRVYASILEGPDYRAIRIPFSASPLGFVCVLPKHAARLATVASLFDADEAFGPPRFTELALPKFRADAELDLIPPLLEAGVRQIFENGADFTGMTAAEPGLQIGQIRHHACIDVHEAGCFAAAATVVAVAAGCIAPSPEPFSVDQPFLFFIRDDRTGAVLMRGHVLDPRG